MHSGKDTHLRGDLPYLIQLPPVRPDLLFQDERADLLLNYLLDSFSQRGILLGEIGAHPRDDLRLQFFKAGLSGGLVGVLDRGTELFAGLIPYDA